MKKIIWNTILIYLIGLGVVVGISFLGLLAYDDMGAFLLAMVSGYFILPIVSLIVGFRAGSGKCDILTAIVISIAIVVIWLYFVRHDITGVTILFSFSPLALTLLSFGVSKLIGITKGLNIFAYSGTMIAAVLLFFFTFYLIGAYQSGWSWLGLPQELFLSQPKNSIVNLHGESDEMDNHILYADDTNKPYTGKIISYKKRLNLDFFTKKSNGIGYYIDGFLFGNSGEIILPGYHNSWYGTDEYFSQWAYRTQNKNGQKYLLHNSYQEIIKREFPAGEALYYSEQEYVNGYGQANGLPKIVVVYKEDEKLVRKELLFHQNGVIDRIDFYQMNENGWKYYNGFFDNVGFINYLDYDFDQKRIWSADDFLESDFDTYEYMKGASYISAPISDTPDKMIYVLYPENWDDNGNLVDNLIAVYGFPVTTVSCAILDKDSEFTNLKIEDGNNLLTLIGRSTLKLNFLETDDDTNSFQYHSTRFRIYSEDGNNYINLYFNDDKLLIEDGPYYLDLISGRENESEEDRSLRKESYQKFLKIDL